MEMVVDRPKPTQDTAGDKVTHPAEVITEHIVEFVCDSGEGAQTAGQMFGTVSAKMGNGIWTVEIIPAEIEPPHRSRAGGSGNRIRVGADTITNSGDAADVVIAFNEQVLYSRIDSDALHAGTVIFLENKWATDGNPKIREEYATALTEFRALGYIVHETPMETECKKHLEDPRRGKNMWALGLVSCIYDRDRQRVATEITNRFKRKGDSVVNNNLKVFEAGYAWAEANTTLRFRIEAVPTTERRVVMNGNQAAAMGVMAAGIEVVSMYPITPATSLTHYLAASFDKVGGFIHQAEDEIAAIGYAIGASYAGKTAATVTSGPGLALKTEFIGLAIMAEIPLVIINVQRGGPSTGLPTRVEQGDLLAALYASPGDVPKIIMAPATIAECFHQVVTARQLAETLRTPVMVLTDANLATGQQPFELPEIKEEWMSPPIDQSDWDETVPTFAWDPETGLSQRPIPGQRGGNYVLTGLAHNAQSKIAYESATNQETMAARSRKFATFHNSLRPPKIHGDDSGDLLVVGWGSTLGAIDEAVDKVREAGGKVSSIHLRFLSPLEPGLKDIFDRFKNVMTIELNYSDELGDPNITKENRRYAQLAWILRATTLTDVDCWSRVPGSPLAPGSVEDELRKRLGMSERQTNT